MASNASELEKANDIFAIDVQLATKLHIKYLIIRMAFDFYMGHTFQDSRLKPILQSRCSWKILNVFMWLTSSMRAPQDCYKSHWSSFLHNYVHTWYR